MPSSSATARPVAPDSSPTPSDPGRTVGKYELLRLIARGGMGEVHLARLPGELGFEKRVVIKTIRPELAADPRFVELFAAEAKTAVALSHPNITPIYELGRAADGTLFTAMGWVDGPSLERLLERLRARGRTLELGAALFIVRELLDGLAHAHRRDRERPPVVHRDVTPRNVLVDRSGRVQIVDFGIAKPAAAEAGGRMGSVGYMAPEQARGEPVDPRADVFGVGCVLYELLTNTRALVDADVWMLPSFARTPAPARPLLERSLALAPGDRFADAEAFLRALAPILASEAPEWSSFGARDLAALLTELFGEDWEPSASEGDDSGGARTPATRITGAVETFATRVQPVASGTEPDNDPEPAEVAEPAVVVEPPVVGEPQRSRSVAAALVIALAMGAGLIGFGLARADREGPEPDSPDEPANATPEPRPRASEPPEPVEPTPTPSVEPPAITLALEPADARVYLDGVLLPGPRYAIEPSAERTLELRVEHPDFRGETVSLAPGSAVANPLAIELEPREHGSLTVLAPAVAWAEVWVDGAKIGSTPLTDKPVLEGKHKLEVRCTAAVCGSEQTLLERSIKIRPGRPLELRADL